MFLDWLVLPQKQKASPRRGRRRRATLGMLPSARVGLGGRSVTDPFSLYPCTRMHGADFEAGYYSEETAVYL